MTATATLVEDRGDDRLYRVDAEPPQAPQFRLVSKYGSGFYGNQMTCVWSSDREGETNGTPLATYYGHVTHDEAMARFGCEVSR